MQIVYDTVNYINIDGLFPQLLSIFILNIGQANTKCLVQRAKLNLLRWKQIYFKNYTIFNLTCTPTLISPHNK